MKKEFTNLYDADGRRLTVDDARLAAKSATTLKEITLEFPPTDIIGLVSDDCPPPPPSGRVYWLTLPALAVLAIFYLVC